MQTYKKPQALLSGLRPGEKFLLSVVILFILGLIFQFLGAMLAAWIYDFRLSEILSLSRFEDPRYIAASKLIQIMGTLGTFILPAMLFSYLFQGELFSYYSSGQRLHFLPLLLVALMMISVIPLINYLAEINQRVLVPFESLDSFLRQLQGNTEEIMEAFMATRTIKGFLVNLFMIGVLAAIGEELIFRGLLQRLLGEMFGNLHIAILVTAIFFSAFHFEFFSFLPRFILGVVLGYLMVLGRSIWYPILAHFVNNAMGVIYYYLNSRGSADDMLEDIGTSHMIPVAALASLLLFSLFFILWVYQVRKSKD